MTAETFTKSGIKAQTTAKLDKKVFGVESKNHELLKAAYLSHLANGRDNLAAAKRRGQVRGGGQKPWRQKGTGRARFGSSRNPIWRGGGVAFGPTGNENYSRKLSHRTKHEALRQALSLSAKAEKIKIIETFECQDGKVKPALAFMAKIEVSGNVLLVVSQKDALVERSTRNITGLKAVQARYLSVFDVLNADQLVITKKALEMIHAWLGDKAPNTAKEVRL